MTDKRKRKTGLLWLLVVGLALACPSVPLAFVLLTKVRDTREELLKPMTASLPRITTERKILLITVPGWPSMKRVVHVDEASGPTPVGFQFQADEIAKDVSSILKSRGVEVLTMPIDALDGVDRFSDYSTVTFIYPVQHQHLPWELMRFFDETVEARVVEYQPGLRNVPLTGFALGDMQDDVESAVNAMEQLVDRYQLSALANTGIVDTSDRLQLYEETTAFAEELLNSLEELSPQEL